MRGVVTMMGPKERDDAFGSGERLDATRSHEAEERSEVGAGR